MKKKGSVFDLVLFMVVILALALIIIMGWRLFNILDDEFDNNPDISSNAKTLIQMNKDRYVNLFNGIFLTFFLFLPLALIVGAYFIDTHPVFFIASVFISVFLVLLGGAFSNVYEEISTDPELSSYADDFTFIDFIMENYVKYTLMVIFLVIIVTYAKNRES